MQNIPADIKQLSIEILGYPYGRAYAVATPAITNAFSVVASDAAHDLALLKLKMPVVAIVLAAWARSQLISLMEPLGIYMSATLLFYDPCTESIRCCHGYTSEKIVQTTKTGKLTSGKQTEIGQSTLNRFHQLGWPRNQCFIQLD